MIVLWCFETCLDFKIGTGEQKSASLVHLVRLVCQCAAIQNNQRIYQDSGFFLVPRWLEQVINYSKSNFFHSVQKLLKSFKLYSTHASAKNPSKLYKINSWNETSGFHFYPILLDLKTVFKNLRGRLLKAPVLHVKFNFIQIFNFILKKNRNHRGISSKSQVMGPRKWLEDATTNCWKKSHWKWILSR